MTSNEQVDLDPEVIEDLRLVVEYQETNDKKLLNSLLERWTNVALGTAMQVMANQSDAEDIVQEAYIKIIKSLKSYRGSYGIRSWVMRIVYNTCIDKKREESKRKKREENVSQRRTIVTSNHSDGEEQQNELFALIKEKWDGLPQRYRMPVWMRHYEKMEFKEIASVLSVSENTVRSQAKRGLSKLKELLSKSGVTLTAVLLTNALAHVQSQASSKVIISNIPTIIEETSIRGVSSLSSSLFTLKKIILLICVTMVLGAGVIVFNSSFRNGLEKSKVTITPELFKGWVESFNSPNLPATIRCTDGKLTHKKSGGKNNSGCFLTQEGRADIRIKLPKSNYPIKFSYTYKVLPQKERIGSMAFYEKFDWFCQIQSWGDIMPIKHIADSFKWVTEEYYLLENAIILKTANINCMLNIYNKSNQREELVLILKGKMLLDDFKLEKVDFADCPDFKRELEYLNKIPNKMRKGVVSSDMIGFEKGKILFKFKYISSVKQFKVNKEMPNEKN